MLSCRAFLSTCQFEPTLDVLHENPRITRFNVPSHPEPLIGNDQGGSQPVTREILSRWAKEAHPEATPDKFP